MAKGGDGPSAKECPTVDWRGIFGDRKPPKSHVEAVGPPVEEDPDLGDMSDGVLEVMNKLELDSDRVFQCSDIIVRRGGVLSVKPWDGKTGGVLRMRARGTVTIEEGGKIDVSNCGYRGFPAVFNNMEGQSTQGDLGLSDCVTGVPFFIFPPPAYRRIVQRTGQHGEGLE